MTKPFHAPKHRIFQLGPPWTRFSSWMEVCQFEECCTCGATHENQYRVTEKNGQYVVETRVRRAHARTKIARRFMAPIVKKLVQILERNWYD